MKLYFLLSRKNFVAFFFCVLLFVMLFMEFWAIGIPKNMDGIDNFNRVNYALSLGYKMNETPIFVKNTVIPQNDFGFGLQNEKFFPLERFKGENVTVYGYSDDSNNVITLVVLKGQIVWSHVLDGGTFKTNLLEIKDE